MVLIDEIICGSTLDVLRTLSTESIDCVITSPPYRGLRDYGIEGQLGLEPTFNEYITNLQTIFNEIHRVLKKTGTCWVNMGDTYSNANNDTAPTKSLCNIPHRFAISMTDHGWIQRNTIIWHKPSCMPSSAKDRFTVDFDYVFFFVKNKKYWFEQQFEAQSPHSFVAYGKNGVVPLNPGTKEIKGEHNAYSRVNIAKAGKEWKTILPNGRNRRAVWSIEDNQEYWTKYIKDNQRGALLHIWLDWLKDNSNGTYEEFYTIYYGKKINYEKQSKFKDNKESQYDEMHRYLRLPNPRGKRKSTTWRINPQPFKDAHFAVFPEKLVEPMVAAGCPSAICDSCGYVFENNYSFKYPQPEGYKEKYNGVNYQTAYKGPGHGKNERDTNKEVKKCDCNAPTHPGIVLDPFVGSGTTALVARKLGRHYIGIDLNPEYVSMAEKRLSEVL